MAFPKGNKYMSIDDRLGPLFVDDDFCALYASVGQPSVAPTLLAQEAENTLLDELLNRFQEEGWLKKRGQQRTASTYVLGGGA